MKEIAIAIVSLIVGAIVGPYINWGIEKRKQKLAYKRELIIRWRDMLASVLQDMENNHDRGYYWHRIETHPHFTSLRPQLKSETCEEMRKLTNEHECHLFLVKKVGEIEKKWDLV
jgi:hypothetical protein